MKMEKLDKESEAGISLQDSDIPLTLTSPKIQIQPDDIPNLDFDKMRTRNEEQKLNFLQAHKESDSPMPHAKYHEDIFPSDTSSCSCSYCARDNSLPQDVGELTPDSCHLQSGCSSLLKDHNSKFKVIREVKNLYDILKAKR